MSSKKGQALLFAAKKRADLMFILLKVNNMAHPNTKQFINPIYKAVVFIALTVIFILLNKYGVISEKSEVPGWVGYILDSFFSINSIYVSSIAFFLTIVAHAKLNKNIKWRSKVRKVSLLILMFLTSKFYTWSALFFSWAILSYGVSYIHPVSFSFVGGLMSLTLGWVIWWQARLLMAWAWKQ